MSIYDDAFQWNDARQAQTNAYNQAVANQWSNRRWDDQGSPVVGGFDSYGSRVPGQQVTNGYDPRIAAAQMAPGGRQRRVFTGEPQTDAVLGTIPYDVQSLGRTLGQNIGRPRVPGYSINGNQASIIGGPDIPDIHAAMTAQSAGDIGDMSPEDFVQQQAAQEAARQAAAMGGQTRWDQLYAQPQLRNFSEPQRQAIGRYVFGESQDDEQSDAYKQLGFENRQKQGQLMDNRLNGAHPLMDDADYNHYDSLRMKQADEENRLLQDQTDLQGLDEAALPQGGTSVDKRGLFTRMTSGMLGSKPDDWGWTPGPVDPKAVEKAKQGRSLFNAAKSKLDTQKQIISEFEQRKGLPGQSSQGGFGSEEEARSAGKKNGDIVMIRDASGKLRRAILH